MNTQGKTEKLDALLAETLSPERDAAPTARDLERARLALAPARRAAAEDGGVERRLALSGAALALIEFIALIILTIIAPPQTLASNILAGFLLLQTFCLFTCSVGFRAALRRLRSVCQAI